MKYFDVVQGSDEWLALRKGVPTSSRFDQIITPKTGVLSAQCENLIDELIAERLGVDEESPVTEPMLHGSNTEAEARRYYRHLASQAGWEAILTNGGFCKTDDDRWGSSPDSLVCQDGILEIKCPLGKTHIRYLREGVVPPKYLPQIHGSLIVTGRLWADFLSFRPRMKPLLRRVVPDDNTKRLRDALEQFWAKFQVAIRQIIDEQTS